MIRAMYSAISGMMSNQTAMDVIGNDIANVNTTAYKSHRTTFDAAYAQVNIPATASKPVGISIGLGSNVVSVQTNFKTGAFQRTNVTSDLGISGGGFFKVNTDVGGSGTTYYSRAGDFIVDNNGYLRSVDGSYVQGYGTFTSPNASVITPQTAGTLTSSGDIRIPTHMSDGIEEVADYSFGSDGAINLIGRNGTTELIGYVTLTTFQNENGLAYQFSNYYLATQASGAGVEYRANSGTSGSLTSGVLELSNVDIASEFASMITTQRGFDANAKTITAADEMLQTAVNIKR